MAATTETNLKELEEKLEKSALAEVDKVLQRTEASHREHLLAQQMRDRITGASANSNSSTRSRTSSSTRRRQTRSGGRREEFLTLIREKPGITVADAAREMDIPPNYLYRLRKDLMESNEVEEPNGGPGLVIKS